MANELTISISASASKGGASASFPAVSKSIDMTGNDMAYGTQAVGLSEEALAIPGDIATIGCIAVKNLDATNFVWIYQLTGATTGRCKLLQGAALLFTPQATTIFGLADTAPVNVAWFATEV